MGGATRPWINEATVAKISAADIINLGLTEEMYNAVLNGTAFESLIGGIIENKASALEGRIGSALYTTTAQPNAANIKRAELCQIAAEMVQIRINIILGEIKGRGQEVDVRYLPEFTQRKAYLDEAEGLLSNLTISGYSGGVCVTSHFGREGHYA